MDQIATQAACRFESGDPVKFTDKDGLPVTGTFLRYDSIPGAGGMPLQGYIVAAQPYGFNQVIECFVAAGRLERGE